MRVREAKKRNASKRDARKQNERMQTATKSRVREQKATKFEGDQGEGNELACVIRGLEMSGGVLRGRAR